MTEREIRRNPFTKEWIIYSESRQKRPDRDQTICPLCVGSDEVPTFHQPIKIPNKYPSLYSSGDTRIRKRAEFFEKVGSYGFCDLVIYTDDHFAKFMDLPKKTIINIFRTWNEATKEYSTNEKLSYILPFENYGEDVGASLIHPHGQIYAFSILPNKIKQEIFNLKEYKKSNKNCMICDYLESEVMEKTRVIYQDENLIVLIPYFARYAYDIYIYPKRHINYFYQTTRTEMDSFANTLPRILKALNNHFEKEISYSLSLVQAPLKSDYKALFHMHFKIHTPQRNKKSLKILGAVESTLDFFINGTLPENAADNIRRNL